MSSPRIQVLQQENARLNAAVADLTHQLAGLTGQLQSSLGLIAQLKRQLEWFKRQLFGRKSEKRLEFDEAVQASLFAALGIETPPVQDVPTQEVRYRRREKRRDGAVNEQGLRFDASVPVETIVVRDPAIEAIPEAEREVVGEKVTHRLAQEPGSYKILRYVRQVVKRRDTGALATPAAPANVLERTVVDVSFLAGMLVDKFRYHLPLYRQHRRLADSGVRVSRGSLTNWAGRAIDLLEPVVAAQAAHILQGAVIAMDETSVKAGRVSPGKMRTGYFWPVYGEAGELVFHYAPSRAHKHVEAFFDWCQAQRQRLDLLPSSPFGQALAYAAARETGLRVYLEDPGVSIDTNHLERGLRPIPAGRRNWLFAWTELGARRIGVIQSLLATCQLQSVNPYTYLVDVLQRVARHPARGVIELTPRVWKMRFADGRYARTCNGLGIPQLNKPPKSITASFARLLPEGPAEHRQVAPRPPVPAAPHPMGLRRTARPGDAREMPRRRPGPPVHTPTPAMRPGQPHRSLSPCHPRTNLRVTFG